MTRQNWGGDWRMPTDEEWTWLMYNCTWTWSDNPYGYTVTSKVNGNSIFLPAAGDHYWGKDSYGYYWSSSLHDGYSSSLHDGYSSYAYLLSFDSAGVDTSYSDRYFGYSVRPVRGQSAAERYVELGPGVRWAKMNIGAITPEDYGDYFAWGETRTKTDFSWDNYKWGTYSYTGSNLTRYVSNSEYGTVDGRTLLLPQDDAATAAWGGDWRTGRRHLTSGYGFGLIVR